MKAAHRAVVMAGGRGTRLSPLTNVLPKPLLPVDDMPILEVILRQLGHYGFGKVTLCVGYRFELIRAFFRDGWDLGVEIDYIVEERPQGTVGALSRLGQLEEPILVMHGDVLTSLDYADLYQRHTQCGASLTLACSRQSIGLALGRLSFDDQHVLTEFREKPQVEYWGCMGVSVVSPETLRYVPRDRPFGLDELCDVLIGTDEPPVVRPFEGLFLDLGRPEDYEAASRSMKEHRAVLLPGEAGRALGPHAQ